MRKQTPNFEIRNSSRRAGLTLVELLMAVSVTSVLSIVLGGLMLAVRTAHEHSTGLETSTTQATAASDRIRYMVAEAGVYQLPGEPTTAGLAVVHHRTSAGDLPDVLVVWSGGRSGGMAGQGVLARLPRVEELVIYCPDPQDAAGLVEITVPGDSSDVDFRSAGFAKTILSLIASAQVETVLICDRIRPTALGAFGGFPAEEVGNVRFTLEWTPDEAEIDSTAPGSAEWYALPWAQGIVAGDSGLRQANVCMEFQVESRAYEARPTGTNWAAVPYFASASHRYVYSP